MNTKLTKCELKEINATLVNVCNAIASVINVDVTIVDSDLYRIIGTGRYAQTIGMKLSNNCVFAYALKKGEKFIIENPRTHEACSKCDTKRECIEWAQVCCPIKVEESIVGIIGLTAFNEAQKSTVIMNEDNLLCFLDNMADLIAARIRENRKAYKVSLMAKELETLVNSMDIGVVSTNEKGEIIRYNAIADEIFSFDGTAANVSELIKDISIADMKAAMQYIYNKEFEYELKGNRYRGFYNAKPILNENEVTGFVFTFSKISEIIKVVNDVSSGGMVISFNDIIGSSSEINIVKDYARKIACSTSTVLIQGESGTGKELFARAIHYHSDRRNYPFVAINCTAIPENLIESELFGYEEGAFTGARKGGRLGKFELANKGTIFLDEIGDMPINLQAKLLRVIQESRIERVGGNAVIPVNVRLIAASNKLLEEKVRDKEFREDLFYRLNVIPIFLPPLKKRVDDILILALAFLKKYNYKLNRSIKKFDASVIEFFEAYAWPGNVRELENTVEYAVNMCTGDTIFVSDLPRRLKETNMTEKTEGISVINTLEELEKMELHRALEMYGRSNEALEKAAKALGISRATIYRKLKKHEL